MTADCSAGGDVNKQEAGQARLNEECPSPSPSRKRVRPDPGFFQKSWSAAETPGCGNRPHTEAQSHCRSSLPSCHAGQASMAGSCRIDEARRDHQAIHQTNDCHPRGRETVRDRSEPPAGTARRPCTLPSVHAVVRTFPPGNVQRASHRSPPTSQYARSLARTHARSPRPRASKFLLPRAILELPRGETRAREPSDQTGSFLSSLSPAGHFPRGWSDRDVRNHPA